MDEAPNIKKLITWMYRGVVNEHIIPTWATFVECVCDLVDSVDDG